MRRLIDSRLNRIPMPPENKKSPLKGTSRRTWLTDPDLAILKKISETTRLEQTSLLTQIIQAGLAAIGENEHTFKLPLKFEIHDDAKRPGKHHDK